MQAQAEKVPVGAEPVGQFAHAAPPEAEYWLPEHCVQASVPPLPAAE